MTAQQNQPPKSKKVVVLDSLQANKIINQLVSGDVAKAENKQFAKMDSIMKIRLKESKAANFDLLKSYKQKQKEVNELNLSISEKNTALTKQKNKTTILAAIGGTSIFFGILAMIL
jgi:hypothetical protein